MVGRGEDLSAGGARVAGVEAPLALYRRYRPETFAEVIGQDHVTAPLRNALSNNRVNHAYLFSGPRGCGKTTSARILARAINCEKGPIAEPCGVCKSCTDLARGGPGSIDVIEIDAASHGGVDDARDLRERAFFAPVESRYKIYIIDEAHMVTTQGFNALLKLVEEPPPHLKFIFATTEPDKVIGTIRSRTHHYPFRLVPPKVLGDYMASLCQSEGVAIEPAALPLVVRAGAGSVRDSLSVLDQLIGGAGPGGVTYELAVALLGFTPDSLLDACVDGFAAHDSKAVFETIEKVIETGQDPKRFAEDLLRRLRDLVVLSAVPNAIVSGLIEGAEDQGERLQTQAAGIGAAELTRAADIVAAGLLEMRGATAPRLQLELICAKVLLPGADDSTNGIQARLDRMERRLAIGVPGTADAGQPAEYASAPGPDAATSRAAARAAAGAGGTPTTGNAGAGTAAAGAVGASTATAGAAGPGTTPAGAAGGGTPAGASGDGAATAGAAGGAAGGAPVRGETGAGASGGGGAGGGADASGSAGGVALGVAADAGSGQAARDGTGSGDAQSAARAVDGPPASAAARSGAWADESAGSITSAHPTSASASAPGSVTSPQSGGAAPAAGGAGAAAAPSAGAVGLADIRRLWPEVLEAVKAKRRFAWIMLSQNAQVIAIDDQTLTLGLVNAGARESFARSGSDEILRQAMIDTIGLNRRVEAVVDPSTDPGAGGGHHTGGPRSGGPQGAPGGSSGGAPGGSSGGPAGSGGGGPHGGGSGGASGGHAGTAGAGGAGAAGAAAGGAGAGGAGGAGVGGAGAGRAAGAGAGVSGPGAGGAGAGGPGVGGPGAGGTDAGGPGAGGPGAGGVAAGAGASGGGSGGASGFGDAAARASEASSGAAVAGSAGPRTASGGAGAGSGEAGGAGAGGAGAGWSETGGTQGSSQSGDQAGVRGPAGGVAGNGSLESGGQAGAGSGDVGGPGSSGRTGQWTDEPGAAVAVQEPPDSEYDVPPEPDPWDDGPTPRPGAGTGRSAGAASGARRAAPVDRREQAASKRRAAEAAVAAEQARRAAAAPAAPAVPLTPEEEADAIGEDDIVLEEDSRSHTDLLRETLGAQIITEEPN
ncbi:DNA polymerase III subunit gamma and tau [Kribbella sp. NPDC023972]|uniref:DNA polymerase III subunit gamma and tau n=1 Tax=Kribbella sp. NPDC023972 TaxID=3154795 RepID=UPI0033C01424